MSKFILMFMVSGLFIGCSNFQITGVMCNDIKKDLTATIPEECRRYSESEAQKAFDRKTEILSTEDAIRFTK